MAAAAIIIWLVFSDRIWHAWLGDIILLLGISRVLWSLLKYRRSLFAPVPEGTAAWRDAAALKYSSVKPAATIAANTFLVLVLMLNASGGFTLSCIRSLLDGGGVVSAEFSTDSAHAFYSDEQVTDEIVQVPIPDPSDGTVWIDIAVIHTPYSVRLSLDGKPLPEKQQLVKDLAAYALLDYFKQKVHFDLSGAQLHDGSTLTLTCGNLVREWVFDAADEEAS